MHTFKLADKNYESSITKFNYFLSYRTTDDILEMFKEITYLMDNNIRKIAHRDNTYYVQAIDKVTFNTALSDVVFSEGILATELSKLSNAYYNLRFYLGPSLA